jgi:ABC-type nitrate/sulfonate/bicarbonate transport system substrate-binding protein
MTRPMVKCGGVGGEVREIRLGTFSPSVLLEVARQTGELDRADLAVTEVPASSSPEQFADLFAGRLDAALTNPDNVLAYRCVTANPLGRTGDVRILAAVDRGLGLSLFTGPSVASFAHVRGGTVGVDVRGSGFAFICFELLERAGLIKDSDYQVAELGATPRRAEALLGGLCAATVLNAGNDVVAESRGAHRMASVTEIGPYVGSVLTATGERLHAQEDVLRALVAVLSRAAYRITSGEAPQIVRAAIQRRLGLNGQAAGRHLAVLTDAAIGLVPDGRLSIAELETVLMLRGRHTAGGVGDLDDVVGSGLIDERLLG